MTVHLVAPSGRGGVYQHTMALAGSLASAGVAVEVYTAADAEDLPLTPVFRRRTCIWGFGHVRPRWLRQGALVAGWLAVGVPTCIWRARRDDVVHIQGWSRPALLLPLMSGLGFRRCTIAWSPHNTFSRARRASEEQLARWVARRSDVVLAFSKWDRRRITEWGARAVRVPLPLVTPRPPSKAVTAWRRRWLGAGTGQVVLFAGHVRPDRGLDMLLRSAAGWTKGVTLAVVGEDVGGTVGRARQLAEELGVDVRWDCTYQPLLQFVAALAAADVIVCPYRVASQSGVLALARSLGRPTIATAVGGLPELATVVVPSDDVDALSRAIRRVLEEPPEVGHHLGDHGADVAKAYLEAYGLGPDVREGGEAM